MTLVAEGISWAHQPLASTFLLFYPDLINVSDFVPGKADGINLAEAYHAGEPFEHKKKEALTV